MLDAVDLKDGAIAEDKFHRGILIEHRRLSRKLVRKHEVVMIQQCNVFAGAASMPEFIGAAGPPEFLGNSSKRSGTGALPARPRTIAGVPSDDASLTTTISAGSRVCANTEASVSRMKREAL